MSPFLCPTVTGWHNYHILWRTHGGKDTIANRVLVHPTCHQQIHSQGLDVRKPCLRRAFERLELHEWRHSRSVLRGGGDGNVTSLPDAWAGDRPGLPGPPKVLAPSSFRT